MKDETAQKLKDHIANENAKFNEIKEDLRFIKDNHLRHIEGSINKIENDLIKVNTNQEWQLKFFWVVVSSAVGSLILQVLQAIYN